MKTVMVERKYIRRTRTHEHSRPNMGVNKSLNKEILLWMTVGRASQVIRLQGIRKWRSGEVDNKKK